MIAMSASEVMTGGAQRSGLFTEMLDKPFDEQTLLDTVEHCLYEDGSGEAGR